MKRRLIWARIRITGRRRRRRQVAAAAPQLQRRPKNQIIAARKINYPHQTIINKTVIQRIIINLRILISITTTTITIIIIYFKSQYITTIIVSQLITIIVIPQAITTTQLNFHPQRAKNRERNIRLVVVPHRKSPPQSPPLQIVVPIIVVVA